MCEPKDVRTEDSYEDHVSEVRYNVAPNIWLDPACWEEPQAFTNSKFTQRIQRYCTYQGKIQCPSDSSNPRQRQKCLLGEDPTQIHGYSEQRMCPVEPRRSTHEIDESCVLPGSAYSIFVDVFNVGGVEDAGLAEKTELQLTNAWPTTTCSSKTEQRQTQEKHKAIWLLVTLRSRQKHGLQQSSLESFDSASRSK